MKFLADACVSMTTVRALRSAGHDATHLSEQGLQRLPDLSVMEKAAAEGRVVLTFDLDFADLLALRLVKSPSVVIFRLHDETPVAVNSHLLQVISERQTDLEHGALIVVEDSRYRLHRLPIHE